jgi:hypothetical protein
MSSLFLGTTMSGHSAPSQRPTSSFRHSRISAVKYCSKLTSSFRRCRGGDTLRRDERIHIGVVVSQVRDRLQHRQRPALGQHDAGQPSFIRRFNLHRGLVGLDFKDDLPFFDRIAKNCSNPFTLAADNRKDKVLK